MSDTEQQVSCANCEWTGLRSEADSEIKDYFQRVEAGGEVPAGECPECGCLCYIEKDKHPCKEGDLTFHLPPKGSGKKRLPLSFMNGALRCTKFCEGAAIDFDWYNDRLQILIFDNQDEPALHVRFNADGTIAEIVFRDELKPLLINEQRRGQSEWEISRDGKEASEATPPRAA